MSLNKKYCNICDHECHCVGKGYFVNSNQCGTCICDKCDCRTRILGAPEKKKSWWQRYVDWLFGE